MYCMYVTCACIYKHAKDVSISVCAYVCTYLCMYVHSCAFQEQLQFFDNNKLTQMNEHE